MKNKIALMLGAGAFGTSISCVLAHNFDKVVVKIRSKDVYDSIKNSGINRLYLPKFQLPNNLIPCLTWEQVDNELKSNDLKLIVSGLPTKAIKPFFEENFDRFTTYFQKGIPLVSLSKGIDSETLELPDDLFLDLWPNYPNNFLFLSGPSYAEEIMEEQITLVTIAGNCEDSINKILTYFATSYFRALGNRDIKGVLLGGALKNVIAIAGGVIEGLGYNYNTRAAMITRGILEMLRFGVVYNAKPQTFYGLSGMGDLILTTTGDLSRNKQFGLDIANGIEAEDIISSQRTVVEGYLTSKAAYKIAKKHNISANIFNGVYRVLYNNEEPKRVIRKLMNTPTSFEI